MDDAKKWKKAIESLKLDGEEKQAKKSKADGGNEKKKKKSKDMR